MQVIIIPPSHFSIIILQRGAMPIIPMLLMAGIIMFMPDIMGIMPLIIDGIMLFIMPGIIIAGIIPPIAPDIMGFIMSPVIPRVLVVIMGKLRLFQGAIASPGSVIGSHAAVGMNV